MLTFGVSNPNAEAVQLEQLQARLRGGGGSAATIREVRLILDLDGDAQLDTGEPVLSTLAAIPASGMLEFVLSQPLRVAPDARERFLIIADIQ